MKNTFLAIAALFIFNLATAQQKPTPADREKIESTQWNIHTNAINYVLLSARSIKVNVLVFML